MIFLAYRKIIFSLKLLAWAVLLFSESNLGFAKRKLGNDSPVYTTQKEKFKIEVLAQQSDVVWGFDFLDREKIIFTERQGIMRLLDLKAKVLSEVKGFPSVRANGQGGLLDIRVHPSQKTKIYWTYSEPVGNGATTGVAFGNISGNQISEVKKIFLAHETSENEIHFGSRIEFDGKGHILISIGDRNQRERVQSLKFHNGKIIRLKEGGGLPSDNPFLKTPEARAEVFSLGHRNPQGLTRNPTTLEIWSTEMGPRGGDELNLISAGANYGWPVVTYGTEYSGGPIGEGTSKPGMKEPVAYWVPSISPSALTFYSGSLFPGWKGNIFIACLSGTQLRRIELNGNNQVIAQEVLLKETQLRFRNVRTGPDGYLYFSTDDGKLARLIPAQ